MKKFSGPFPLEKLHSVSQFDCGKEALNTFLIRFALLNQANDSARTFVALEGISGPRVVGYYSLAASSIVFEEAPERMKKGLAHHPIPAILMARFAVDRAYQGQGIGGGLFKDAIKRCLNVSREAATRAFVVQAKDEDAKARYEHFEMQAFPSNPFHLFLLMKDIERTLGLRQKLP